MKIVYLLSLLVFTSGAAASGVKEYMDEGIKLHDEGHYDKAQQKYKMALKLEPNNPFALYELSLSYMVSKKNEECIETANKGLKLKSKIQKKFNIALGSCYSQAGKTEEAIKSFEGGLVIAPKDSRLHLNIAVTLSNIQQDKKAVAHLKEAIKYSNGYASPYYLIAEIYRTTDYRIPAIFFYMQFVLLEPNTARSEDASKKIYSLLFQGLREKENGDMDIFVNPDAPKDEGDFSALELAMSLSAAAATTEENKSSKNIAEQYTEALTGFITICKEIEDKKLDATFTSRYAMKNMVALQSSDVFNTYAYIIAARAGVPGATIWLDDNRSKIKEMSSAIEALDKNTLK